MPDRTLSGRPRLRPVLAPLQVGSLALGCVIGFGCFILAGDFLETAGPLGAALGIALGGLAMVVIARSYGLMVRTFPVAGAEFAYAYRAAGRHHAVICGWFLALGYLSIVPLNATALTVLGRFLAPEVFARGHLYTVAGFEVFAGEVALAAFAVILVAFLHSRGVEGVGRAQAVLTGVMVTAVALVGIGAFTGPGASVANWEPWFAPGRSAWTGILAMLAISPWLYVGFDTLPQAAEEFAFPAGKAFRLMAVAILAGAGMYVIVLLATGVVLPWRELVAGESVWATGATVRASLGTAGVAILSVAVVAAIFTGINGFFMASSRLLFSMGRARLLPAWFGSIDPARGTPRNALAFTGAVSLLAPWFGREVIVWVVDMAAVGTACGYLYTCLAAFSVTRRPRARVEAVLGALLSAGFLILLCVPGMPGFMALPSWIALGGWIALGALFYFRRAREFAAIPDAELDGLILGASRDRP
ncbi:MAG: APC family permease [Acidobacteriota bacterium]|nr:APC family permease [Acidobacteriota bacterium]